MGRDVVETNIFLLKIVAKMLDSDKPTVEKVQCARQIVGQMIEEYNEPTLEDEVGKVSELDDDAEQARKDLM